ncbi:MAG: hypothetical protein NT062_27770 [Proteobacteria bacterium]|nr:hypothetical protein [Pseudomonadota bacterium]
MKRLLLAFPLGGCPLLEVQVEVREACVTRGDIAVPGVPVAGAVEQDFTFGDLAPIHELLVTDASLRFVRAEVHATSAGVTLDFVDRAHVTIASADPDSTLPTLEAYDCEGDCIADDGGLALSAMAQDNVLAYLASSGLAGHVTMTGQLPTTPWTMEATVCISANLKKTLEP